MEERTAGIDIKVASASMGLVPSQVGELWKRVGCSWEKIMNSAALYIDS